MSPAECTRGSGTLVVLQSADGTTWRRINVDALLGPGVTRFAVGDTAKGTIIAGARQREVDVTTHPSSGWSVIAPEPIPAPAGLPPLTPSDGTLEMDQMYRHPLNVHCGLQWLGRFNGRTWKLQRQFLGSPGDARALGLPQIGETLLGTVRLTDPDTIEYAIAGLGIVATYSPTLEE